MRNHNLLFLWRDKQMSFSVVMKYTTYQSVCFYILGSSEGISTQPVLFRGIMSENSCYEFESDLSTLSQSTNFCELSSDQPFR